MCLLLAKKSSRARRWSLKKAALAGNETALSYFVRGQVYAPDQFRSSADCTAILNDNRGPRLAQIEFPKDFPNLDWDGAVLIPMRSKTLEGER